MVINEFTNLNCGVRADLALVSREEISAFEIKSEYDSIRRLERQVSIYRQYFDRVTLVVAPCHREEALQVAAKYGVGVWVCDHGRFKVVKRGQKKKIAPQTIRKALLPSVLKGSPDPRGDLYKMLSKKYKARLSEIDLSSSSDIDKIKSLNPNYIRRMEATGASQRLAESWLDLCKSA